MTKFWDSVRFKRSSKPPSDSSATRLPTSNSQPDGKVYAPPSRSVDTAGTTNSASLAPVESHIPAESRDQQRQLSSSFPAVTSAPKLSTNNDEQMATGTRADPGWMTTAYGGTKVVLELVREASDVFTPLKSVVGGLSALLKQYDQYVANKDDIRRLIIRVEWLTTSLTTPPRENDINELERRRALKRKLVKILEILNPMLNQSKFSGFLNNADQAAQVIGLVEDIRDAIMDYQTSLQQDINNNALTLIESTDFILLDKLQRSKDAGHLSGNRHKCLIGTRVMVLEKIENWVYQDRIRRVYWLNGVAGSGKSTIAQSFAERMFAEGLLGASFFCSRYISDRRNLHFIFPTLAFQLAYKYPAFRVHLLNVIKSIPDVGYGSLENQLTKLVVEPLRSTGLSTVIIIDALDECEDGGPASAILSLLAREIEHLPLVKFFITGRPEPRIRSGFRIPTLLPQTEVLLLHKIERENVDGDVKKFLEYHLIELVKHRSDFDVNSPWPSSEDIQILISKTAGLFIYASTVIRFLSSISHNPRDRLRLITSMPDSTAYEGQLEIDPLYTCLLDDSCSHVHGLDLEYFSKSLLIVSSIVLLCEPIPVVNLARLLKLDSKDIFTSLRSLHSVLLVPESDSQPVRIFHKSFPDYLTNNQRCRDPRFFVDSSIYHGILALRCLELMTAELKQNICNLPRYALNSDIEDLSTRQQNLVGDSLGYACKFWAKHIRLMSSTGDVALIVELLNKFVQRYLLRWLEVLSILKGFREAIYSLLDVERWLIEVKSSDTGLLKAIRECQRFVFYSFDVIEHSAVHIYDSALVWTPTSSLIRTLYRDQLTAEVEVLNPLDTWDACIRSIPFVDPGQLSSVVFSHGGDLIAGCGGSIFKIFESATGVCLGVFEGHNEAVFSVAFSSDDAFIASGSGDASVRVWDVQTGALVTKLEGHEGVVRSVAFSPAGTVVASGADDKTIRIWDFTSGGCERILRGHTDWVLSVCWLRAEEVVSGGRGGGLKVWDMLTGECVRVFDQHSGSVFCVTSSPDGSQIASGSGGGKIRIYDSRSGDVIRTVVADEQVNSVCFSPGGDKIVYGTKTSVVVWDLVKDLVAFQRVSGSRSVAFSPDGNYIATRTPNGFVKIFQIENGNQGHEMRILRSERIICVGVATDGQTIVSGSEDNMVRLWDTTTSSRMSTLQGHSQSICAVAFSPDCSLIASGSYDKAVRIWSALTNKGIINPCIHVFQGHSSFIQSIAFSPDSSLVASGSADKTIRIWSLHDGSMITILNGHHDTVFDVKFSSDGKRIVSVTETHEIILWDVEKSEKLAIWPSSSADGERDSRISFSVDGNRVTLEFGEVVKRWNVQPSGAEHFPERTVGLHSSEPPSEAMPLQMVLVPILDDDHQIMSNDLHYRYLENTGWVLNHRNKRVCWIPADWRGVFSSPDDKKIASVTNTGRTIVLDFSHVTS